MAVVLSKIYQLIVSKEISAKDFNGWEQMPVQVRECSWGGYTLKAGVFYNVKKRIVIYYVKKFERISVMKTNTFYVYRELAF